MTLLFVGSYAPADEPGIHAFRLDEAAGALRPAGSFAGVQNPSFLALHPGGGHLYAVSETGRASDRAHGAVQAFRIDRSGSSVDLVPHNRVSTDGDYPCHLCIDGTGRRIAAANYGNGSVAVFPLLPDGAVGAMTALGEHSGSGPNRARQEGPHAHASVWTPDDRFLIVADLGIDQLVVYRADDGTGSLIRHGSVATSPGAGPRHLAFHPGGAHLFVVNELANSLTLYRYVGDGELEERQTLSTLPAGAPENTAADLHLSPSGRHVYVSNRGHNSIAVFAFDPADGLGLVAVRPCGGNWPRGFGVDPGGRHLVVANRRSNEVVVLPLLDGGADVGEPSARAAVPEPSCVVFG